MFSLCVTYCVAVGRAKAQEAAAQRRVWIQDRADPRQVTSIFEPDFQQSRDVNPNLQVIGLNAQLGDRCLAEFQENYSVIENTNYSVCDSNYYSEMSGMGHTDVPLIQCVVCMPGAGRAHVWTLEYCQGSEKNRRQLWVCSNLTILLLIQLARTWRPRSGWKSSVRECGYVSASVCVCTRVCTRVHVHVYVRAHSSQAWEWWLRAWIWCPSS